jgi:hypothetical protein
MPDLPANTRPTRPIGDLIAAAGGRALTICPECGKPGFYTGKPWRRRQEKTAIFRTRRCRFCGHAALEKVTVQIENS